MQFPIPVFFIAFVLFLLYLAYRRNKQTQDQQDRNEAFLERERLANATRKKDISGLAFLPFSAEQINFSPNSDETLLACEETLKELSSKKIINLSMYSNTDLKLMYGPANLNDLTEYDDNYQSLADALRTYAQRASELNFDDSAISALECAMRLKIDDSRIYVLLAELYKKHRQEEKIEDIRNALSSMDEKFARSTLSKLN